MGSNPRRQIVGLVLPLFAIIAFGTVGYHVLLSWGWVESLYMTVITITTVGYGEVHHLQTAGRLFTIVLVMGSIGIVAYGATTIISLVMETQFRSLLWRRRMEQKIKDLKDHYIIRGIGRTGKVVCSALQGAGLPFVAVDNAPEKVQDVQERVFRHSRSC